MFSSILLRSFLLLFISGIGWGVGKRFQLDGKSLASLLIYVISPFVIFYSIVQSPANGYYLIYALAAFIIACIMACLGLLFARLFWQDNHIHLFAFAAGTGNTGYFALPLALAIFNQQQIAIAIFIIIGVNCYEFSVGYFLTAKGAMGYRESLKKVIKMPILYAALLGILFKYFDFSLSDILLSFLDNFKGAYSVLGMMTIGITLAQFSQIDIDWRYAITSIFWKHVLYPIMAVMVFIFIIPVDLKTLQVIGLMAATPMAANVVIISSALGLHPEKAVTSVMLSSVFAVVTIPLVLYVIDHLILPQYV
ncbi:MULTISPECIES: AEC family transporter [unclassified Acinetobacter]|uniref:AEC family transporter n=1 Tax=unclassified Acinetobacter TaxID=196816 RepID=UPI002934CD25|nr:MULTISPECIES: AEC family transporter [unclassified Acinetobacter]WOE31754.1 AEC family transporter [Acinetobacter sp. SAAs470]WOE37221.1 AEC family transporter [Acinetobacter sp. SAAs474]